MEDIVWAIIYLILFCLFLSSIISLVKYRQFDNGFKIFSIYIITSLVFETTAIFLGNQFGTNYLLVHLFTFIEFILLSLFYLEIIKKPLSFRRWMRPLMVIVLIYIVFNTLFIQGIDQINSYSETIENLVLIAFSLFYFYNSFIEEEKDSLKRQALNLINSGIFLYLTGSLFIFMFSDYLLQYSQTTQIPFFLYNGILNLIFKILILYAIIKIGFYKTNSPITSQK